MNTSLRVAGVLWAVVLGAWAGLAGTARAQGPLIMAPSDTTPQPCFELRLDRSLEGARGLEQLLRTYGSLEGQIQVFGDTVALKFADIAAAVRFLQTISPAVHELPVGDSPWTAFDLKLADPRHVRALIGADILARGVPVDVRCTARPPRVLINGPVSEVQRVRHALQQLDVPAPQDPSPEDVVRMYLERWLIVPDDSTGPDYAGMYELTTLTSRQQIGLPEFSAIMSRSIVQTNARPNVASSQVTEPQPLILGAASGLDAEISGVYPASFSPDGRMAVVAYSVSWFGAPEFGPVAQGGVPAESWVSARRSDAEARRTQIRAQGVQAAQNLRVPVAIHRSYGLLVREPDGSWRIPMVFDEDARTWLTPLSPTLPDRIAPALVPRSGKPGDVR